MNMGDKIFRIEVPQKTVTQMKGGKKQEREEKIFPGYVLVEMIMDEDQLVCGKTHLRCYKICRFS